MTLTAMKIYLVMLIMLGNAGASDERVAEAECRLRALASAIDYYSYEALETEPRPRDGENRFIMISIAYQETRFMYRHTDGRAVSSAGACGPYQQIPRYAHPNDEPITCEELQEPMEATRRLVAKLASMRRRFGPINDSICHYASGNVCTERGEVYAERHHDLYATALRIWRRMEDEEVVSRQQQLYQEDNCAEEEGNQ